MGVDLALRTEWRVSVVRAVGLLAVAALLSSLTIVASSLAAGDQPAANVESLAALLELVIDADTDSARSCLRKLAERMRSGEVDEATVADMKTRLGGTLSRFVADPQSSLHRDAILVAAIWRDAASVRAVVALAVQADAPLEDRQLALATLVGARDPSATNIAADILGRRDDASRPWQLAVFAALAQSDDPDLASAILDNYDSLASDAQSAAIELLTRRIVWSKPLLARIASEKIPKHALNVNQVRKLLSLGDSQINQSVAKLWGAIREGRDPAREQLIRDMRRMLDRTPGDSRRGIVVFAKLCGQCHKIHGAGQEVGPDITLNGRASYDQLLSNVFDPSLVIGEAYQARIVRTDDGRVVTGLLAEDSEQRVVLKVQGGKLETIARDEVVAMKTSELSLMPEGIEKQLQSQEIADLFAFITLDKHPDDKSARLIPGTPARSR
jgi:putative heme-binding domain-containing protein